jgi:hypothetical protein
MLSVALALLASTTRIRHIFRGGEIPTYESLHSPLFVKRLSRDVLLKFTEQTYLIREDQFDRRSEESDLSEYRSQDL